MCGLSGFINLSKSQIKVEENLLIAMQQKLKHRGPDAFSHWKSDEHQIGLSHSRLSIVDLSDAGLQPMFDQQKTVAICFNGEIYNHKSLRKQLEGLGYKYFSNTDTETLIYAYKEWGIDFLHKLNGMFAIAIFDLVKDELYLVRDRIGIKPLYFSLQNGVCSFVSEIKALWVLPWMKKEISQTAFYHYLTFMVSPAPYTIYDKVYKLPAGFYMKVDRHKQVSFKQWYSVLNATVDKGQSDENYCLEKIDSLLNQSMKDRMMADVPVGAFLSGGLDSSLNVALMSKFSSKLKTFTVAFSDGPEINELKWARKVAKIFGTDHHEIVISEKEAFDFYQDMIYHLDEPLADPVCVPFYYVAKLARDAGITVAQVGEGADELFFGYSTYASYQNFYKKYFSPTQKFLPGFIKKGAASLAKPFINKTNRLDILNNWANGRELFWGGAIAFNETEKKLLLDGFSIDVVLRDEVVTKIYSELNQGFDSYNIVDYHLSKLNCVILDSDRGSQACPPKPCAKAGSLLNKFSDFGKKTMYLELQQRLPELLLMRADKMSMAASLEARVPFLDHRLVEFMFNVPVDLKFKNNQTKYLLKKVAEKYLPSDVIYRKKMGFATPTERWFEKGKFFPAYFEDLKRHGRNKHSMFWSNKENRIAPSVYAVQNWVLQNFESII